MLAWSPLVAVGRQRCRATLHGRRGTWRHLLSCGWRGTWRILETSTCVWRGRRGTWRHLPAFGVAGVALVALGVALGRRWSPLVAPGAAPLCVAGVALGDIHLRSAWQVWHLETSTCVWRGNRGTCPFHVAVVALGDIYLRFTWQAWHMETSTCVWRGRHGTWRHLPAFGVSGVALVALGGALGRRWSPLVARGAAPLCVAGVALGDIHPDFAWQALHLESSTCVWRGRRGTLAWQARQLCHIIYHLSHTNSLTLSHTISLTQLCHTPSFSHTTLSQAIFLTTPSFTRHLTHTTLSHTIFITHNFVTHYLSHVISVTQLCHTPSFSHHLSHTTLSPTIFDTPSFTHNFFTHHLSHTTLSHTIFHHTIFHTQLCHTHTHHLSVSHTISSFTYNFVTHTQLCFTSRSSTTSFVFPSFPVPATTYGTHYWKKLPCGVIRSFNFGSWLLEMFDISFRTNHAGALKGEPKSCQQIRSYSNLFLHIWHVCFDYPKAAADASDRKMLQDTDAACCISCSRKIL